MCHHFNVLGIKFFLSHQGLNIENVLYTTLLVCNSDIKGPFVRE